MTSRRGFLIGLGAVLAAPAIVKADSLMKLYVPPVPKIIMLADYSPFHDARIETGWFMRDGQAIGTYNKRGNIIDFAYWIDQQVFKGEHLSMSTFHDLTRRDRVELSRGPILS